jgi:hypothetical protein
MNITNSSDGKVDTASIGDAGGRVGTGVGMDNINHKSAIK